MTILQSEKIHIHLVSHILANIGLGNNLLPTWHQDVTWTNTGMLSYGSIRTNLSEISIKISKFSFKTMHFKILSAKYLPFFSQLNVLIFFFHR